MKNIKRIFTLIMVLAMVMSLAVPAMADEGMGDADAISEPTYTITITHPGELTTHQYEAYQIFTGDLSKDANDKEVLSNIEWGEGVDGAGLLADLQEIAQFAAAENAQAVADILSQNNTNTVLVDAFCHVVGKNLVADEAIPQTSVSDKGVYTWENVYAGYYLIKDKDGSLDGTDEIATNYIMQVVGDTTVAPKGGQITHDKTIDDGGNHVEAADYSIGDDVTFVLYGTLPANYGDFETFSYKFVDTLSTGLTFNDDVSVYLENAGTKQDLSLGYVVNYENPTEEGATFTVDFANLKDIPAGYTIDRHTTIIVEYTAKVNEYAVIGGSGNVNSSYLVFDNDPHGDGEGKTPEDKVFVFTWELDVFKIDGNNTKLEGAEFILYRSLGGVNQYLIVNGNNQVTGWTENETEASKLVSNAEGKFIVQGLEADTYYLKETKAPEGYNLLENPIMVDITASVTEDADGQSATVNSLQIKVDNQPYADGDKTNGIVSMNVVNNPGATLPETGGMGTTLFYVFGGLMVAAAVVLLVTKKRMSCEG